MIPECREFENAVSLRRVTELLLQAAGPAPRLAYVQGFWFAEKRLLELIAHGHPESAAMADIFLDLILAVEQRDAGEAARQRRCMMTDKLLEGLTAQAMNMAKTEIRYRHCLHGILAVYVEGEGLKRLRKIEREIEEKAGEAWLNSGQAKDILFGVLLAGAATMPPDAIVVATMVNRFEPNAAFLVLPDEEKARIVEANPGDPQYFAPHDALMALAQTPERVCIRTQRWEPKLQCLVGEPEIGIGPQSKFTGRLKLFGVEPDPDILATAHRVMGGL